MNIQTKDAAITNTDDEFPGSFRVILSSPTKDRDGETLAADEWKMPLPEHITFDVDHEMSVRGTIGSGHPYLNDADQVPEAPVGALIVDGTYSSVDDAQQTRTKVGEGHIRTTSVAFMTEKTQKDGKSVIQRELLNGAFVAVPSNREALVLSSKAFGRKAGARNSASDAEHIQSIHDHALALGATPATAAAKRARRATTKAVDGSLEATQDRARDALQDYYPGQWIWLQATIPAGDGTGTLVFNVENPDTYDDETYQQAYTDDGSVITLSGDRTAVDLMQIIKPDPDDEEDSSDSSLAPVVPPAAAGKTAPAAETAAATPDEERNLYAAQKAARIRAMANIARAKNSNHEGN